MAEYSSLPADLKERSDAAYEKSAGASDQPREYYLAALDAIGTDREAEFDFPPLPPTPEEIERKEAEERAAERAAYKSKKEARYAELWNKSDRTEAESRELFEKFIMPPIRTWCSEFHRTNSSDNTIPAEWLEDERKQKSANEIATLDRLMRKHIKRNLIAKEERLSETRWRNYRHLHPAEATILFAKEYYRRCAEIERKVFFREHVQTTREQSVLSRNKPEVIFQELKDEIGFFWKGRQSADEIGATYGFYVKMAMEARLEKWNRPYMPRPNQLLSEEIREAVEDARYETGAVAVMEFSDYTPTYKGEWYQMLARRDKDAREAREALALALGQAEAEPAGAPKCFGRFFIKPDLTKWSEFEKACDRCEVRAKCRLLSDRFWEAEGKREGDQERSRHRAEGVKRGRLGATRGSECEVVGSGDIRAEVGKVVPEICPRPYKLKLSPTEVSPSSRLRELLDCDANSGVLRCLVAFGKYKPGDIVRTFNKDGYLQVMIDDVTYGAHRVVWAMVTGQWPKGEIHHVNHDRSDNRFCNLREVTRSENMALRRPAKGVSHDAAKGWRARFKGKHLGWFDTEEEAQAAVAAARAERHGDFAGAEFCFGLNHLPEISQR